MKVSKFLFYLFAIVFFVFAVLFVDFSNYSMTDEDGGSRFWLMRIILLLDIVCLVIMMLYMRKLNGIHLVCLLWLLIMPVNLLLNNAPMADIVRAVLWPFIFETTYLCCRNFVSRGAVLKKMYILLAVIGAFYFLRTRLGAEHQTNTIYFVYLTLPWLLFESKKALSIVLLFAFTFLAMLSLKRSMLLSTVLIWGFYFLFIVEKRRNRIFTIFFSLALVVGIYMLYDRVDESLGGVLTERVNREETDIGKDRMAIWNITWSMIQNSSTDKIIVGHGHFGVRRDSFLEISAHNDFLEVIYDYGLVIFVLYLGLWWHVIRQTYRFYREKSPIFIPYAVSLSIFLIMSLVSLLILYATYFNYLVMFWGLTEAIVEYENKQNKQLKFIS